jgi:hypothetical protein
LRIELVFTPHRVGGTKKGQGRDLQTKSKRNTISKSKRGTTEGQRRYSHTLKETQESYRSFGGKRGTEDYNSVTPPAFMDISSEAGGWKKAEWKCYVVG